MPVSLSIKNVPVEVAKALRERAKNNHRSLNGELLAILDDVVPVPRKNWAEVRKRVKALGLKTADDSVQIIRELRDSR